MSDVKQRMKDLIDTLNKDFKSNDRTYSFKEEGNMEFYGSGFDSFMPFGSATIPPLNRGKDLDYLVYTSDLAGGIIYLLDNHWCYTGTDRDYTDNPQTVPFTTFRRGCYNVVITDSSRGYKRMRAANDLCQTLKLSDKADRIAVFDTLCGEID